MCVLSRFSRVQLFVTLWTVTYEAPLSMRFSHKEIKDILYDITYIWNLKSMN